MRLARPVFPRLQDDYFTTVNFFYFPIAFDGIAHRVQEQSGSWSNTVQIL